jgi:hypothetical protein
MMGGCKMGDDPKTSVVRSDLRHHRSKTHRRRQGLSDAWASPAGIDLRSGASRRGDAGWKSWGFTVCVVVAPLLPAAGSR